MPNSSHFVGSSRSSDRERAIPEVSIIVPARNEEANIGACLESLTTQTGVSSEIIVVDDCSSDRTREIIEGFAGVRLLSADPLRAGVGKLDTGRTGKNSALIAGAEKARGSWLLFTDADTVHYPGSLARALNEAKKVKADLLSYSPEQRVVTFSERSVMPIIFAELAARYPLHKVRDQDAETIAANGQYILVRRDAYDAVGGHVSVGSEILEDVALAKLFRQAGLRVYFRYGGDAVRARMYRSWQQLREGWTKNLALLFPQTHRLALRSLLLWFGAWGSLGIAASGLLTNHPLRIGFIGLWLLVYRRIRRAHFSVANNLMALLFGPPIFSYLLLLSSMAHKRGKIAWKGRSYQLQSCEVRSDEVRSEKTVKARLQPRNRELAEN
jgi:glycosyltransferase involved in cell wall biosynthesis